MRPSEVGRATHHARHVAFGTARTRASKTRSIECTGARSHSRRPRVRQRARASGDGAVAQRYRHARRERVLAPPSKRAAAVAHIGLSGRRHECGRRRSALVRHESGRRRSAEVGGAVAEPCKETRTRTCCVH
eukprot:701345-Prymnesium_polylepis.1